MDSKLIRVCRVARENDARRGRTDDFFLSTDLGFCTSQNTYYFGYKLHTCIIDEFDKNLSTEMYKKLVFSLVMVTERSVEIAKASFFYSKIINDPRMLSFRYLS